MKNKPATSRYVLCRRDLADIGATPVYCAKPIKRQNVLDWCPDCRKRLPFWPPNDEPAPAAVPAAPAASADVMESDA